MEDNSRGHSNNELLGENERNSRIVGDDRDNDENRKGVSSIVSEEVEPEVEPEMEPEMETKMEPEMETKVEPTGGSEEVATNETKNDNHNTRNKEEVPTRRIADISDSPNKIEPIYWTPPFSMQHAQQAPNQQQLQMMNVNQHMQSMNLVAHYEAQMRDHLAAFTHAAAGAAWAAAQLAFIPPNSDSDATASASNKNTNAATMNASSSAAASAAAAAAAVASSAVSQLQQQTQQSPPMSIPPVVPLPYMAHHDPNVAPVHGHNTSITTDISSMNPPMNPPMNPATLPSFSPSMPPIQMSTCQPWTPSPSSQFDPQPIMPNSCSSPMESQSQSHPIQLQSTQTQYQARHRNRGRNENIFYPNHPNKRHQGMQEQIQPHRINHQQPCSSSEPPPPPPPTPPHDAYISLQMQQMQFQSPPQQKQPSSSYTPMYTPMHNSLPSGPTNKRPHSSSSSWQGSGQPALTINTQLDMETMKTMNHPNNIYNPNINHSLPSQTLYHPPPQHNQQQQQQQQQLYQHYPHHSNNSNDFNFNQTYNTSSRSTRRLWSPNNANNENNKRTMHKKFNYSPNTTPTHTHIPNNHQQDRHNSKADSSRKYNQKTAKRRSHSSLNNNNNNNDAHSSGGGSQSNGSSSNNTRKNKITKKRSSHTPHTHLPRPFNPIGKTGVMALHELCSKQHWPPPKFVEIQPFPSEQLTSNATPNALNKSNKTPDTQTPSTSMLNSNSPRACLSTLPANSFLMAVILHEHEYGRGRGGTKAAARQDAARQALLALLPGTAFDQNGILIHAGTMPADDLAPLASRLAIHPTYPSSPQTSEDSFSKRYIRPPSIYPYASSGMSSSEDENSYYASRGASVCSTLLHAMWQIDPRIQEPPKYDFEVCSPPLLFSSSSVSPVVKGGARVSPDDGSSVVSSTPVAVHRSSFACTAYIILRGSPKKPIHDEQTEDSQSPSSNTSTNRKDQKLEAIGTGATKREAKHVAFAKLLALLFPECDGMVAVMAAAESAREQYAATKALTKQHKRALSQSNNNNNSNNPYSKKTDSGRSSYLSISSCNKNELSFALPQKDDPMLPKELGHRLRLLIAPTPTKDALSPSSLSSLKIISSKESQEEPKREQNLNDNLISVEALSISESTPSKTNIKIPNNNNNAEVNETQIPKNVDNSQKVLNDSFIIDMEESSKQQLLRQKQLEEEVDMVLQKLLEIEDENRSSFGVNSIDEVGRIILRRATVYDNAAMTNLLSSQSQIRKMPSISEQQQHQYSIAFAATSSSSLSLTSSSSSMVCSPLPQTEGGSSNTNNNPHHNHHYSTMQSLLWGGSSVILVLSRAIAGYDEPPLGCAVLMVQFSLTKGRILNICEMAHEGHLPRERFMECLEAFASNMKCTLQMNRSAKQNAPKKSEKVVSSSGSGSGAGTGVKTELSRNQLKKIFMEYVSERGKQTTEETNGNGNAMETGTNLFGREIESNAKPLKHFSFSNGSLQAVEEVGSEEEEADDNIEARKDDASTNKVNKATRNQHKPSKRSRVS